VIKSLFSAFREYLKSEFAKHNQTRTPVAYYLVNHHLRKRVKQFYISKFKLSEDVFEVEEAGLFVLIINSHYKGVEDFGISETELSKTLENKKDRFYKNPN